MMLLRDKLGQMGARIAPGAGGFWSWWTRSLLAWLPARWLSLLGWSNARVLLAVQRDQLKVYKSVGAPCELVTEVTLPVNAQMLDQRIGTALAGLPRYGVLPAASVLRRTLWLPAAAERRLRDVVRFEIDRQTPFTADQVYFDTRLLSCRADGQLEVELVVVPRERLQALLHAAPDVVNTLEGVDVVDAEGSALGVNLLPVEQRRQRQDPMQRWNRLLALCVVVLVASAGWLLLENRRDAAQALRAQVDANAQRARAVAAQRQQLQDLVDGAQFFDQQRAARPPAIAVLDELSRRLPDGSWVEKVSLEGGQMQLVGLSGSASTLVSQLEGSPLWKTPSLTGVLQAGDGQRRDRFTMTAELQGMAPPKPEVANGAATQSP